MTEVMVSVIMQSSFIYFEDVCGGTATDDHVTLFEQPVKINAVRTKLTRQQHGIKTSTFRLC